MANTYRKIYLHIVFAVKNRNSQLDKNWRPRLFEYMAAIIKSKGHYSLAINGVLDHCHILIDYNPRFLIEDLIREIKKSSSKFIKEESFTRSKFEWQSGYGVFSVGANNKKAVIEYIKNQELHHKKNSFQDEYLKMLKLFEIDFQHEYIFDFID